MNEILKSLRSPTNGTFELTARCNLACKMCLFKIDNKRMQELGGREKTTEEWIDMAKQVAEAGTIKLLITGGEPMLRPDFCEIYEAIVKMGFVITLYTNATMITPKIMESLKRYPPHKIGITLYGASPETYEKVCGNSDAYERAINGIDQLSKLPSKLELRTTIIKDNLEDLDKMRNFIKEKYGEDIPFNVSRIVVKPVRGGISDVESCRLEPKDSAKLMFSRSIQIAQDFGLNEGNSGNIKFIFKPKEKEDKTITLPTIYGCSAGMDSYAISWDGKLLGCQMLSDCWTNPFNDGFKDSWDNFLFKVKQPKLNSKCSKCDEREFCSSCVATRIAETGDGGGFPEYICNEVKEIKKYIDINKGEIK